MVNEREQARPSSTNERNASQPTPINERKAPLAIANAETIPAPKAMPKPVTAQQLMAQQAGRETNRDTTKSMPAEAGDTARQTGNDLQQPMKTPSTNRSIDPCRARQAAVDHKARETNNGATRATPGNDAPIANRLSANAQFTRPNPYFGRNDKSTAQLATAHGAKCSSLQTLCANDIHPPQPISTDSHAFSHPPQQITRQQPARHINQSTDLQHRSSSQAVGAQHPAHPITKPSEKFSHKDTLTIGSRVSASIPASNPATNKPAPSRASTTVPASTPFDDRINAIRSQTQPRSDVVSGIDVRKSADYKKAVIRPAAPALPTSRSPSRQMPIAMGNNAPTKPRTASPAAADAAGDAVAAAPENTPFLERIDSVMNYARPAHHIASGTAPLRTNPNVSNAAQLAKKQPMLNRTVAAQPYPAAPSIRQQHSPQPGNRNRASTQQFGQQQPQPNKTHRASAIHSWSDAPNPGQQQPHRPLGMPRQRSQSPLLSQCQSSKARPKSVQTTITNMAAANPEAFSSHASHRRDAGSATKSMQYLLRKAQYV